MNERLKEYYIDNSTSTDQIITFKKETDCGVYEDVEGVQQIAYANVETKINFPSDGVYEVFIDDVSDGIATYYLSLFNSLIVYIGAALCGDFSSSCLSKLFCGSSKTDYSNNAYSKMMYYYSNYTTKYNQALIDALDKIRCSSKDTWDAITKEEAYRGISNTNELLKIELAHLYLEMYAIDVLAEAPEDVDDLKELYNYDKIENCISKLGILDCTPAPIPGTIHTKSLTATPTQIGLGTDTVITLLYKFTANSDTFVSIIDTNIDNVDISKFDGFTHSQVMNITQPTSFYITYSYTRAGTTYQDTVTSSVIAYTPQWFGGESAIAEFAITGGKATVNHINANINNIAATYQATSNGTSSNTNTSGKYIWWITTNAVKFYIGAFEILSGPWDDSCDPNNYAIIHKTVVTIMPDGVTERTLHFYRTCPLQELPGQTLSYTLTQ